MKIRDLHTYGLRVPLDRPFYFSQPGLVFHVPPTLREYGRYYVGGGETVVIAPPDAGRYTQVPRELFVGWCWAFGGDTGA